ncbi:hypothetical protein C8Q79DRAFT_1006465 [Trametes meyenii]|nr:hypothetical protein C8Q79DRAFT_1006465 [Trametes meyenii]
MAQFCTLPAIQRPAQIQAALKDQLAFLDAQALTIRRHLNALSLPSRLPPEILAEIFLIQAALTREAHLDRVLVFAPFSARVGSYYRWIHVAHVCHYWRDVALSCSEFKAFMAFESWTVPDLVQYASSASDTWCETWNGDHPLTVVYHQNGDNDCRRCSDGAWYTHSIGHRYLSSHLHRLRRLVIIIETDDGTRELWKALSETAGVLESLRIGLRGEARRYHTEDFYSRLTLPDLFDCRTPSLISLTTSYVSYSWSNPFLCPTLRHLEVNAHPGHLPDLDFQMFITALEELPHLETLVTDCLPHVGSLPFDKVTSLPRLRMLRTTTTTGRAAFLLFHIRLSSSASIHLDLQRSDDLPHNNSVLELARALAETIRDAPLRVMSWSVPVSGATLRSSTGNEPMNSSSLKAWAVTNATPGDLWVSKPDVAPRLTIIQDTIESTKTLLSSVDLAHLDALHIAGPMPAKEEWMRTFAHASNVVLLRVTGRVGSSLGTCLSRLIKRDDQGIPEFPLPRLQTLQFVGMRFEPLPSSRDDIGSTAFGDCCCDYCEAPGDDPLGSPGLDLQVLIGGLRRRIELGGSDVEQIEFLDCFHIETSHAGLRTVRLDGIDPSHTRYDRLS